MESNQLEKNVELARTLEIIERWFNVIRTTGQNITKKRLREEFRDFKDNFKMTDDYEQNIKNLTGFIEGKE